MDRVVGSVDNMVEFVRQFSWISVVYGSPCMVGNQIMRVKSSKIVVISSNRKIGTSVYIIRARNFALRSGIYLDAKFLCEVDKSMAWVEFI